MIEQPNPKTGLPAFAGKLLIEMLIVFVGVYAAFTLDSRRSERQDAKRVEQILVALQTDFAESQETLTQALPGLIATVDTIVSQHEAGRMPAIGHLGASLSFRSRAWEAMLESGGVDLLDVGFILAVEDYYELTQRLQDRADEGRRMSTALILPQINNGNESFYDPETRKLKKSYGWYIQMLQEYRDLIVELEDRNSTILEQINQMLAS